MLTRLIVSTYKGITELALWVCVVAGAIAGFQLGSYGGRDNGILGMIIGAVVTFLFLAIFLGAALLLDEIHSSLQRIEIKLRIAKTTATAGGASNSERDRRRALGYDD
jgi:hypothetical protein